MNRLTESQKQEIWSVTVETVEKANNLFQNLRMQTPTVEFTKMGTTAGRAFPSRNIVKFNDTLAAENFEAFKKRTVVHEVAHLIDYQLHGWQHTRNGRRIMHGASFKRIMVHLGADPSTCHSYDVSSVRKSRKQYVWTNSVGTVMLLGAQRHKRALAGTRYWMRGDTVKDYQYKGVAPF